MLPTELLLSPAKVHLKNQCGYALNLQFTAYLVFSSSFVNNTWDVFMPTPIILLLWENPPGAEIMLISAFERLRLEGQEFKVIPRNILSSKNPSYI